jgi:uncharacterized protein
MSRWGQLCWALSVTLLVSSGPRAGAGGFRDRDSASSGMVKRHSLKELRDQHVIKQELEFSCGAAALATLLTYYFGDITSEQEILKIMLSELSKDERKLKEWRGFSLLDLKGMAQAKGYRAAGFKLTIEQLTQLAAPVIVFIQPMGYQHFAVLRGVDRGRVFLADPARGNLRMSLSRFASEWNGTIFVLGKAGEENIVNYPLALPRPELIQPELRSVDRLWESQALMIDLATRSHVR